MVRRKAQIYANLRASDLFFVDHDFSYEDGGTSTTGEVILKELLQHKEDHLTCILFTHGASVDQQKDKHAQIVKQQS